MAYVLTKYVHLLGILLLFSTLVVEHLWLKPRMQGAELRRIARVDMVYGLSAGVVLATGLTMWFLVGKGAGFYSPNGIFHAKVALFVLVALLSVYPTVYFLRHRHGAAAETPTPPALRWLLRVELLLVLLLPLLAVLMAQGYGLA
ncbi:DUF2214 family protein [Alkalilimnicola sp. S0819]|uniref:DUF2214 family protein n=1 Tax=Alkalilimnicola sp. S0819 TaxID=2613922 RepID=UPI001262AC0E|nr:DUF2214 family protein [Alkalilimnicola sp. S0819]KAB7622690.1 DUF2214 family protein [Alkalilimnicola sp. S0819]MPQ17328.1 DUF2214 family protein [Alkalilimnicola sp. S0819]